MLLPILQGASLGLLTVPNDDSHQPKPGPPPPPRLSKAPDPPRVIATGQQARVTPAPAPPRHSDTMAAASAQSTGERTSRRPTAPGNRLGTAKNAVVESAPVVSAPVATAAAATEAAPSDPSDPYLGSTVAERYKVIRKLGEGGMGVVYLAEHVFIEKRVALKVLSDDFARKADLVARFMQEAKAASKIGHENIVDITDFGETASGSVFFAME